MNYISNKRTKAKSTQLNKHIKSWHRSVKGKRPKKAWANAMLAPFSGNEALKRRRQTSLDPVVATLCKMADRQPPKITK